LEQKGYIRNLYLSREWYVLMTAIIVLFFSGFFFSYLFPVALGIFAAFALLTITDYALLFLLKGRIKVARVISQRLSLGDENKIVLSVHNSFPFRTHIQIVEGLPVQMQERNFYRKLSISPGSKSTIEYSLRPLQRGAYLFSNVLCFMRSPLKLVLRRIVAGDETAVKVYPSYMQLKKYQLLAISDTNFIGAKKVRRLGHSLEFEKIKDYVQGDDVRTINWKATARRGNIMVNTYTDARQQQIYAVIDKGRSMKMPFDGLTLLDHSINTALALLNVALLKHDKAGLITFAHKMSDIVSAERRSGQVNHLLEALYKQQTDFKESDYSSLWTMMSRRITQRSCILLFTNFETYSSMERQLPYLKQMATRHLVCVIFFRNTLLKELQENQPDNTEGIYIKTIADRFDYEKRQVVRELRRHGILSVLTTPAELTIDVINKYLELKAKQMI
jgi:uncharacterized protein (DUF58 family)